MVEDFELLEQVAERPQCTVHRARAMPGGELIAVKMLRNEDGRPSWEREVAALQSIQGDTIVRLLKSGWHFGGGFLVLEWLDVTTLDARISRGVLSMPEFIGLVRDGLSALDHVHGAGFLHRDVKPANLMLTPMGRWKLIDFGEARLRSDASQQPLMGSLHCMAPEQFENKTLDERTDLYSLGCTLFFALTGRYLHEGENIPELITSHLYPDPSEIERARPDVPRALAAWIEKLLSRQPEDRQSSVKEAAEEFEFAITDSRS